MRRKITNPSPDIPDLPKLTEQQQKFVEGILCGKSGADAYRAAYDTENMGKNTIWVQASVLRRNSKIAVWLSAGRKACLGLGVVTLQNHLDELQRLAQLAAESGNYGAAVQAEQLRGKAAGHYTERLDVTHYHPDDLLKEIREISPELAEQLEATQH